MKSTLHLILATVVLGLGFLFVTSASAQETDPRLQSNGPGWRLERAKIENDKLPRVLLIGDSILNGYMNGVIRALRGKANVDCWVNPYHQANGGLPKMVAGILANGPYDIIHFNMGLHGWKPGQFKEGEFEPATRRLVESLRAGCPKAQLIWASTTPIMTGTKPNQLDPVHNATILEHNRMAAKVMQEEGVPISDFYSLMVNRLELSSGDIAHWSGAGCDILSRQVVATLAPLLKMDQGELAQALARIDEPEWTRAAFRIDCKPQAGMKVEFQSGSENVKGVLPSWGGEPGTLLLVVGPVKREWDKISFTFLPKASGKVVLNIKGDCRLEKMIWVAYDHFTVEGATLKNGDFEEVDEKGAPRDWTSGKLQAISGKAQSGSHYMKAGALTDSIYQEITVEEGMPVTVSFFARTANDLEAK